MKKMGEQNKVLYVQNPYTIKDFFSSLFRRDKTFPYKTVFGLSSGLKKYTASNGSEVYVVIPLLTLTINFLPHGFLHGLFLQLNGWLVRQRVSKYLKRLNMSQNLIHIVAFNPLMGVVNGRKFEETILIYHCYDEIGHAPWMKNHGMAYENKLMRMVDGVVVTSKGLQQKKSAVHNKVFLVKNGADTKLFSTAFNMQLPVNPTVGFIGSLDDRVDYELLADAAGSMPEVKFQFIGRILNEKQRNRLKQFNNVCFVGAKSLQELPDYVKEFSVGIIPFVKDEFTKGIYPLKINEYLAAGLPVVSTNFSFLDDFKDLITITTNKKEFREGIIREIETDNAQKRIRRRDFAMQNSWDARCEELSQVIVELENKD
jgi:glycosyltransferase involved in cell wall biosynthesis